MKNFFLPLLTELIFICLTIPLSSATKPSELANWINDSEKKGDSYGSSFFQAHIEEWSSLTYMNPHHLLRPVRSQLIRMKAPNNSSLIFAEISLFWDMIATFLCDFDLIVTSFTNEASLNEFKTGLRNLLIDFQNILATLYRKNGLGLLNFLSELKDLKLTSLVFRMLSHKYSGIDDEGIGADFIYFNATLLIEELCKRQITSKAEWDQIVQWISEFIDILKHSCDFNQNVNIRWFYSPH